MPAPIALGVSGEAPPPDGLTPHGLRHTFASLLIALGKDPRYVMAQIGHTDPAFTLRLYAHQMLDQEGEVDRLRALVDGIEWRSLGTALGTSTANDQHKEITDARA